MRGAVLMGAIFLQLHKLKKLLDRISEHLPFVIAGSPMFSSENEQLAIQFRTILRVSSAIKLWLPLPDVLWLVTWRS